VRVSLEHGEKAPAKVLDQDQALDKWVMAPGFGVCTYLVCTVLQMPHINDKTPFRNLEAEGNTLIFDMFLCSVETRIRLCSWRN